MGPSFCLWIILAFPTSDSNIDLYAEVETFEQKKMVLFKINAKYIKWQNRIIHHEQN